MQIETFKKNFFNNAVADVLRALDGNSLVGSFILTFCLIDYMAWIEYKDGSNGFKKWIREYLEPINVLYTAKDQSLLNIRHGLIHSYGPSEGMLHGNEKGYLLLKFDGLHMNYVNDGALHIDIYYFLSEVVFGIHTAFEKFKTNITSAQEARMQKQITINGQYPSEMRYAEMHPVLSVFDNPNVNMFLFQAQFTERYI